MLNKVYKSPGAQINNYVYNGENPINEHKVDMTMVNDHATKIRNKTPYQKLIR
jgi:hypothetical protein